MDDRLKFVESGTRLRSAEVSPLAVGGDHRQGFELGLDAANRIMRMRLWGFWKQETGEQFREAVLRLGATLSRPWRVLCDSRQFVAQGPEVTKLRGATMHDAAALGCTRAAVVVESAMVAMQFKRLAGETRLQGAIFEDEGTAARWLDESSISPSVTWRAGRPHTG